MEVAAGAVALALLDELEGLARQLEADGVRVEMAVELPSAPSGAPETRPGPAGERFAELLDWSTPVALDGPLQWPEEARPSGSGSGPRVFEIRGPLHNVPSRPSAAERGTDRWPS